MNETISLDRRDRSKTVCQEEVLKWPASYKVFCVGTSRSFPQSVVLSCRKEMMRRKRSCSTRQTSIVNVHAVVLGLDGVGKSALTVRFLTRRFIGEYAESLEMTYTHHMNLDGQNVTLVITDTAGENTEHKVKQCSAFGDLIFILYSITDRFSFMEAKRLGRYIRRVKNNECVLVLVGTKEDLKHHRRISLNEGLALAKEIRSAFCEISISEGFVETNSLLYESLRLHLNNRTEEENADKEKLSPLSRMKEGFRGIYSRRKNDAIKRELQGKKKMNNTSLTYGVGTQFSRSCRITF